MFSTNRRRRTHSISWSITQCPLVWDQPTVLPSLGTEAASVQQLAFATQQSSVRLRLLQHCHFGQPQTWLTSPGPLFRTRRRFNSECITTLESGLDFRGCSDLSAVAKWNGQLFSRSNTIVAYGFCSCWVTGEPFEWGRMLRRLHKQGLDIFGATLWPR